MVQGFWKSNIYPRQEGTATFEEFWKRSVEAGFSLVKPVSVALKPFDAQAATRLEAPTPPASALTLVLYAKTAMPDGRHAYNPWLQELPDPVTKSTWDNYASLAPALASRMALNDGDVVRLQLAGSSVELPVLIDQTPHPTCCPM